MLRVLEPLREGGWDFLDALRENPRYPRPEAGFAPLIFPSSLVRSFYFLI